MYVWNESIPFIENDTNLDLMICMFVNIKFFCFFFFVQHYIVQSDHLPVCYQMYSVCWSLYQQPSVALVLLFDELFVLASVQVASESVWIKVISMLLTRGLHPQNVNTYNVIQAGIYF